MHKHHPFRVKAIIGSLLLILCWTSSVQCLVQKELTDIYVHLSDRPLLNKKVRMVSTITPNKDIGIATVEIILPEGIVSLGSESLTWQGNMEKDKIIQIPVTFRITEMGYKVIDIRVWQKEITIARKLLAFTIEEDRVRFESTTHNAEYIFAEKDNIQRTTLPSILLVTQEALIKLIYDSSKQKYEKQKTALLPNIVNMIAFDKYFFVNTGSQILQFTDELERTKLVSKDFGKIEAIATDGNNIFIAAQGSFIALNKKLKELSRVGLDFDYPEKNAHDILIHKNTAYLLDNKIKPLFLFRVNIEKIENMRIVEKIVNSGINAHLDYQWLNPELDQWIVVQSYSHRGGYGQEVHIYPMKAGEKTRAEQEIFRYSLILSQKTEGFRIGAITNHLPVWAVVEDKERNFYLSQVNSKDDKISFSNPIHLDKEVYGRINIEQIGSYLFVFTNSFYSGLELLTVIDIKQKPKIVLSQNLKDVHKVINIKEVEF